MLALFPLVPSHHRIIFLLKYGILLQSLVDKCEIMKITLTLLVCISPVRFASLPHISKKTDSIQTSYP